MAFLHVAFLADDGRLEGHALEPRHMERNIAGGHGEDPVCAIHLTLSDRIEKVTAAFAKIALNISETIRRKAIIPNYTLEFDGIIGYNSA